MNNRLIRICNLYVIASGIFASEGVAQSAHSGVEAMKVMVIRNDMELIRAEVEGVWGKELEVVCEDLELNRRQVDFLKVHVFPIYAKYDAAVARELLVKRKEMLGVVWAQEEGPRQEYEDKKKEAGDVRSQEIEGLENVAQKELFNIEQAITQVVEELRKVGLNDEREAGLRAELRERQEELILYRREVMDFYFGLRTKDNEAEAALKNVRLRSSEK